MTQPATRPELKALTSIRGLAAWWVVIFHLRLSMDWMPAPLLAFAAKGYLAVDFFFLLSGFVIWWSSVDRIRDGGPGAIPAFLQRRIARIWPLHMMMLSIAIAMALLLWVTGRHDPNLFPFAELPLHLLLIQNWGFTDQLTWNVPAWSISCELAAYLAFPLLALSVDWRRVPTAVLLIVLVALVALLHVVYAGQKAWLLGQAITQIGVLRCLIEFAAGSVIAALWLRWREQPLVPAFVAGVVAVAGFTLWFAGAPETVAVPIGFGGALLALALSSGAPGHPLEGRVLHYLGEISYATYLCHFLLWFAFKIAFVHDASAVPLWQALCFAALLLVASSVLYHMVERPAQRAINRLSLPGRRRVAQTTG